MTEPHDLRHFALRYTDAWCSGDPARVASFYSPNGSLAINNGPPSLGRPAITEAARQFMHDYPDLKVAMDKLINGDRTEYHWTLTGTHLVTQNPVKISGFESWLFGPDGLVSESKGSFDAADYQRQVQRPNS